MRRVYLDYNATTPLHPKLKNEIEPFFDYLFGNPSSTHWAGRLAKEKIEEARLNVAKLINAKPDEIIFTGSGTESSNIAIKGIAFGFRKKGNHIISTTVEHPCVLNTLKYLESKGFEVTYLPVDSIGQIDPEEVKRAIKKETILITVMYANNETGTVLPVKEIGKIAREYEVIFHSDMVQALGKLKIDIEELNVDLASFSGHKAYAPKGIGFLYVREGISGMEPLTHGGHQEKGLRPGTENTLGIVTMGICAASLMEEIDRDIERMENMRKRLLEGITKCVDGITLNGDQERRLPNTINLSFDGIEGPNLLSVLDSLGIAISSGAACTSGKSSLSHVLLAMGLPEEKIRSAVRISLGKFTEEKDIDYAISVIPSAVKRLRER
ncbi:MAG: cysteine desulfurase [Desulfobacterota bacterium]|nr:cysteine desulfurase [Thermodesulfobacteriota bacterium]MDW8001218.1 cysteine desulfurase family protein [Deltaproteobacteria bacterium]